MRIRIRYPRNRNWVRFYRHNHHRWVWTMILLVSYLIFRRIVVKGAWVHVTSWAALQDMTTALLHAHRCMLKVEISRIFLLLRCLLRTSRCRCRSPWTPSPTWSSPHISSCRGAPVSGWHKWWQRIAIRKWFKVRGDRNIEESFTKTLIDFYYHRKIFLSKYLFRFFESRLRIMDRILYDTCYEENKKTKSHKFADKMGLDLTCFQVLRNNWEKKWWGGSLRQGHSTRELEN